VALLVLFVSQVVAEFYVIQTYAGATATEISLLILYAYTAVYIVLGVGLFAKRHGSARDLVADTVSDIRAAFGSDSAKSEGAD
jgi:cation:H+ antiporter